MNLQKFCKPIDKTQILNNAWGNDHPSRFGEKFPIKPAELKNWKPVADNATNQEKLIKDLIWQI
jgi:hypothetical protein